MPPARDPGGPPARGRGSGRRRERSTPPPIFPPAVPPPDEFRLLREGEWSFQALLWQRARDVRLWAATPEAERTGLFTPPAPGWQTSAEAAAADVQPLAPAIGALGALVRTPEAMHAADLGAACLAISGWAYDNHLADTAVEYAEAAAVADSRSPRAAAHAGQMCAQLGLDARAEVWYERGVKLGRRGGDREWYVRSNLRLGALRYEQGDHRAAARCYGRARRAALRAGLSAFAGKAHHDMLLLAIAEESFGTGDRHARRALELYPPGHERLPQLAHDYAVLLTTFGDHARALELLELALPRIVLPHERIAALGTVARAAAGVGDRARHGAAAADVLLLAGLSERNAAGALALSAEGAALLGDWERAAQLARRACETADRRRERAPRRRAAAVLDAAAARTPRPCPSGADPERVAETVGLFAARLGAPTPPAPAGPGPARRGEHRQQTIKPPPPARPWLEEVRAVEAVSPELVGLVLWYALRSVRTLAECLPEDDPATLFAEFGRERREQYASARELAPELAEPLEVFALLRQPPHRVERGQLSLACHRVAAWAEKRGLLALASHFAEAAAAMNPESAERAVAAGRTCRRAAALASAGAWYERAFGLAVREKSRKFRIAALLGYGAVMKAEGRREEAREWFLKAARGAGRTGRARQAAEAHHDLMALAAEIGTFAEMDRHATAALALYPQKHPALPGLAHDLGYGLARLHNYAAAVALVEMARDRMRAPGDRALCWSTLAWAQAGAGRPEAAREAERQALELVAVQDEYASGVLLHLAGASRLLEDWPRARRYAEEAGRAAEKFHEAALAREAEALAAAIDARIPAPAQDDGPDPGRAAWLVRHMRDKLAKWRPSRRPATSRVLQPGP